MEGERKQPWRRRGSDAARYRLWKEASNDCSQVPNGRLKRLPSYCQDAVYGLARLQEWNVAALACTVIGL